MADNETVWESVAEISNRIDKLILAIEQQNIILKRILEALCTK